MSAIERLPEFDNGLLRFLACGSVDDGKSTLIGRLLFDCKAILSDTLSAITRSSQRRGLEAVDLSLLTDGLQAEREQGITIDVAYRYFTSGRRKYIVADAPGHEQYTRNMVTAASTADLAIILIDARRGVLTQTRRHACIAHLLGIPHIVVAVNKIDLVGHSRERFEEIRSHYLQFAERLGSTSARCLPHFIPVSALNGDMVVERGDKLDWYRGATLFETLESTPSARSEGDRRLRFPVQYVCRPQSPEHRDFRGYMGRIESGSVVVGDAVLVLPSGRETRVRDIRIMDGSVPYAGAGRSVTLLMEDAIDISRGDMIVRREEAPRIVKEFEAMLCWLGEAPLDPKRKYLLRHATREVQGQLVEICHRLDINTLEQHSAGRLLTNDIARVRFRLASALCVDSYGQNRSTGAFVVIDGSSNHTVGAGMIL